MELAKAQFASLVLRQADDAYTLYLHPECYESSVFGIKDEKELRSKIFGYEALNNTERQRLWKASS
ncbi:unnamed protein product [Symbiodinium sp. KB8]|nr:unnamed protein product [Symbiodinium sp. KB8]